MTPNGMKGWVGLAWTLLKDATPLSMFVMGLVFAGVIWHCLAEQERMQANSVRFFEALQAAQQAHLELAMECQRGRAQP